MPLNSVLNYVLPIDNPQNLPMIISIDSANAVKEFTSFSLNGLEFSPTLSVHLGTNKIIVYIKDSYGLSISDYFWLTVTNTAPYFIRAQPTTKVISINKVSMFGLPPFSDIEQPVQVIITSIPHFGSH